MKDDGKQSEWSVNVVVPVYVVAVAVDVVVSVE